MFRKRSIMDLNQRAYEVILLTLMGPQHPIRPYESLSRGKQKYEKNLKDFIHTYLIT